MTLSFTGSYATKNINRYSCETFEALNSYCSFGDKMRGFGEDLAYNRLSKQFSTFKRPADVVSVNGKINMQ